MNISETEIENSMQSNFVTYFPYLGKNEPTGFKVVKLPIVQTLIKCMAIELVNIEERRNADLARANSKKS
jgi:hypothetical protein